MEKNEKRRFIVVSSRGRSRRLGLEEVDIEIVDSDNTRSDTRRKTWEWEGHAGHILSACHMSHRLAFQVPSS